MLWRQLEGSRVICRWRPLEAALAAVGSQADVIMECVDDEVESGRSKPIDIEYLLSNVVPAVLTLSGECADIIIAFGCNKQGYVRVPVPPGQRFCICESICQTFTQSTRWPVSRSSDTSDRDTRSRHSCENLRRESDPQVTTIILRTSNSSDT